MKLLPTKVRKWLDRSAQSYVMKRAVQIVGDVSNFLKALRGQGSYNISAKSIYYLGVRYLVGKISTLPLHVLEKLPNGGSRVAIDHPLYRVLHIQTNAYMTPVEWHQFVVQALYIKGNAYSFIRYEKGNIKELVPLIGSMQLKFVAPPGQPENKRLIYRFTPASSGIYSGEVSQLGTIELEEYEVLHYRYMSLDGIQGISPIEASQNMIHNEVLHTEYSTRYFENGANPGLIVKMDVPSNTASAGIDPDEIRDGWEETLNKRFSGMDNSHKLVMLPYDFSLEKISFNPSDSQLLESGTMSALRVLSILGLPGYKFNIAEMKFRDGGEADRQTMKDTIIPVLINMEKRNDISLIAPQQQGRIFTKYNVDAEMRGTPKERAEIDTSLVKTGILTRNEVRARRDYEPIDGGDIVTVQMQDVPLALLQQEIDGGNSQRSLPGGVIIRVRLRDRYDKLLTPATSRIISRETKALKRHAKKHLTTGDMAGFKSWVDEFYTDLVGVAEREWRPVLSVYGEEIRETVFVETGVETRSSDQEIFQVRARDYCLSRGRFYAEDSVAEIARTILDAAEGDLVEALERLADSWSENKLQKCNSREIEIAEKEFVGQAQKLIGV